MTPRRRIAQWRGESSRPAAKCSRESEHKFWWKSLRCKMEQGGKLLRCIIQQGVKLGSGSKKKQKNFGINWAKVTKGGGLDYSRPLRLIDENSPSWYFFLTFRFIITREE
jgi:hypothetical protein